MLNRRAARISEGYNRGKASGQARSWHPKATQTKGQLEHPPAGAHAAGLPDAGQGTHRVWPWLEQPLLTRRHRKANLANWLVKLGYQVCCLDLLAKKPTDIVDEAAWKSVEKDVVDGLFDCVWVARPPKATEKEVKVIADRIHDLLAAAWDNRKTWGFEGPAHGQPGSSIWEHPLLRQLLQLERAKPGTFDGCRFGYPGQRPLQLLTSANVDLKELYGMHCNHGKGHTSDEFYPGGPPTHATPKQRTRAARQALRSRHSEPVC